MQKLPLVGTASLLRAIQNASCMLMLLVFTLVMCELVIDNQLVSIRSDCYERLAIGQRLHPKQIQKSHSDLNTVRACQMACTQEKDKCKAFSFGIGSRGNASCDISANTIRETSDLRPIGTVSDADFDLYIKKLGCSLILDPKQTTQSSMPPAPVWEPNTERYNYTNLVKPTENVHHVHTMVSVSAGNYDPPRLLYGTIPQKTRRPYGGDLSTSGYRKPPSYRSKACFRRVLTGKRVSGSFVKKVLTCESLDHCEDECAYEKRFQCEGFNYRFSDGDCQLLDLPLSQLDIGRDLYPDLAFDYYERDRNAFDSPWCKRVPPPHRRPAPPDYNRRGDHSYHSYHHQHHQQLAPVPPPHSYHHPPPYKTSTPSSYRPPNSYAHHQQENPQTTWSYGTDRWTDDLPSSESDYGDRRPYYTTKPNTLRPQQWHGWSTNRRRYEIQNTRVTSVRPPPQLPPSPTQRLPPPSTDTTDSSVLGGNGQQSSDVALPSQSHLKNECSLRSATGFRLHRGVVRKLVAVKNIYECELVCHKQSSFGCSSFAYRYTSSLNLPTDNCYLSDRDYKELDFYTDLEPDKDYDIYTMNNRQMCRRPMVEQQQTLSECFWRVRSGQRLQHPIVRDSLTTKSIVECQLECLRSNRFTCRSFTFRYGPAAIGGIIDNCQLSDWPFSELNPRRDLIAEPGFEVYERGSYGHGCEPNHFGIQGQHTPTSDRRKHHLSPIVCYVGFGSPARLLAQASRKALHVATELDCKTECSKLRSDGRMQCMSFSYRPARGRSDFNCFLSDILQRDLLPDVDYVPDRESWLFAWDNNNPDCIALMADPVYPAIDSHYDHHHDDRYETHHRRPTLITASHTSASSSSSSWQSQSTHRVGIYDVISPLDTWRAYTVRGWPCRGGSLCRQNLEAGFWYCELEDSDDPSAWDYCCRPDHQCGFSEGYAYQWCYVGPHKTQWRTCSDQYYPYRPHLDRWDPLSSNFILDNHRPGFRPDRPPRPTTIPPLGPSLDEYESEFNDQFLDPPRPGGLGRHWPVSYLHKDHPSQDWNTSNAMEKSDANGGKLAAIQNLIDIIKSNELEDVQYNITNDSNRDDDVLYVKIPLAGQLNESFVDVTDTSVAVTTAGPTENESNVERFPPTNSKDLPQRTSKEQRMQRSQNIESLLQTKSVIPTPSALAMWKIAPVYRRGTVTRTNVTNHVRVKV